MPYYISTPEKLDVEDVCLDLVEDLLDWSNIPITSPNQLKDALAGIGEQADAVIEYLDK